MKLKMKYDDSDIRAWMKEHGFTEVVISDFCKAQKEFIKQICTDLDNMDAVLYGNIP